MKKITALILAIILLSFALSIYYYPLMPERMASHWNMEGRADGYMPRFWGLFLFPLVLLGLSLLFIAIPRIDPLKANIKKFMKYYEGFIAVFLLFMLSVHLQVILWNLGVMISPNVTLPVGIGLLFFYIGILLEHAKRNWFIGIRTPWTLSSERVWSRTHRIGGKLFKVAAVIVIIGVLFPDYAVYFILVPVLAVVAYTVAYSYSEYQKEPKK